nr:hypothetical protein Iba_chr08fCG2450 [Ipomoea batatas]
MMENHSKPSGAEIFETAKNLGTMNKFPALTVRGVTRHARGTHGVSIQPHEVSTEPNLTNQGQVLGVQEHDFPTILDVNIQGSFLAVQHHALPVVRIRLRHLGSRIELNNAFTRLAPNKLLSYIFIHIPRSNHKLNRKASKNTIRAGQEEVGELTRFVSCFCITKEENYKLRRTIPATPLPKTGSQKGTSDTNYPSSVKLNSHQRVQKSETNWIINTGKSTKRRRLYLEEHRQPWQNQSKKEEQSHTAREQAWRRLCSLGGAWEAPPGTMRNKNRHHCRTPSWPTLGKDQDPCFSQSLEFLAEIIQAKPISLLF